MPWLAMAIQVTGSIVIALVVIARELLCAKCAAKKGSGSDAIETPSILSAWFLHVDPTSPLEVTPSAGRKSGSDGLANPLWKMRRSASKTGGSERVGEATIESGAADLKE